MTKPQMTLPTGEVLYEGDYGVTRDGRKVGPVALDPEPNDFFKFMCGHECYGHNGRFWSDEEIDDEDIIGKWVDDEPVDGTPMTIKVGDKIRYTGPSADDLTQGKVYKVVFVSAASFNVRDDVGDHNGIAQCHYEPVTDTPPAPTLWRDMTDAEKGALLLAKHQGKVIEGRAHGGLWIVLNCPPLWCDDGAYRVAEPEPVVETVTIVNADGMTIGSGTVTTHNGKPDPDSIRMESTT